MFGSISVRSAWSLNQFKSSALCLSLSSASFQGFGVVLGTGLEMQLTLESGGGLELLYDSVKVHNLEFDGGDEKKETWSVSSGERLQWGAQRPAQDSFRRQRRGCIHFYATGWVAGQHFINQRTGLTDGYLQCS